MPTHLKRADLADRTAEGIARIRRETPRVHGLTNSVAQTFTANALLALGAIPTMTGAPEEVADFVGASHALYVNLGTLDAARRAGIDVAVDAATERGVPWVLDPAHCEASPIRIGYARALLERQPSLLRVNASESVALFGDRTADDISGDRGLAVAVTGERDVVSMNGGTYVLRNGHPLQARVTAVGCAGTAIVAAFLAVGLTPLDAALSGVTAMNVAAEEAARQADGPGSFAVALLDRLYHLDGDTIALRLEMD